ncbi:MAG: response regulator [Rhodospirillaceae bacterium]
MALILVVDDEDLVRKTVSMMLKGDHSVVVAKNGKDALEQVKRYAPNLVITDIIMPEMEGVELIMELLRTDPGLRVIAMSGGGRAHNFDYLQVALQAGALRILRKPFTKQDLLEAVDKGLKKGGAP